MIQPTFGVPADRFVKAGYEISRPRFYREDSCMLSLFLKKWYDRLKIYRGELTVANLYRSAMGLELVKGQAAGVCLHECKKWLTQKMVWLVKLSISVAS